MLLGQSETAHLMDPSAFYRQITQPTPGDGNLVVFTQGAVDAAPVRTEVNATTVANGDVNPAMAALSAFLDYVRPGRQFVVVDAAVSSTGRYMLTDDSESTRKWSDLTATVDLAEGEFGAIQSIIEMWFATDQGSFATFKQSFWPFYFGVTSAGATFTLGNTNPNAANTTAVFDHCLWDADAATNAKGRGIFTRDATKWRILTPWPIWSAIPDSGAAEPEADNFSEGSSAMKEPTRENMIGWASDSIAQTVDLRVGPSAHLAKFTTDDIAHPDPEDPDGQILSIWPFAIELLRLAGTTISEPTIHDITGPDTGEYCDISVNLPNGGTLTTLREVRELSAPVSPRPHQQAVTGFEHYRADGATRRPIFNEDEASYPSEHRGTVVIQDSGSGSPRRGVVRITPEEVFAYGDSISYLRGTAVGATLRPEDMDANLYLDMLIEHIPALYDSGATYPFEGLAVRPYQTELSVPVAEPSFAPVAAYFDSTDYFANSSLSVACGTSGLISLWLRKDDATWDTTSGRRLMQLRVGSTSVIELSTSTPGRMVLRLNNNTGTDTVGFYAAGGTTQFNAAAYYHVAVAWTASGAQIYVNRVSVGSMTFTSTDAGGNNIARFSLGAETTGINPWKGDIGHAYVNLHETLDLSVSANLDKFNIAGVPQDLGADGSTPTGTQPEFYFSGDADTTGFGNLGSVGGISLTGTLVTSSDAPSY